MIRFFAILTLSIMSASASIGLLPYYGYHGPPAPLSSDGRVVETTEVAHARAAHLAAYAAALGKVGKWANNSGDNSDSENQELKDDDKVSAGSSASQETDEAAYKGPLAPLDEDGLVVDTPELQSEIYEQSFVNPKVARAKAAHMAAHAEALATHTTPYEETTVWNNADVNQFLLVPSHVAYTIHHSSSQYHGPPAPIAPDGSVMDTQEVAEAKAAHLRAYAHAATITTQQENCHC